MRQFETGATRDTDEGKIDFEGFLSPLALEAYGQYMLENQIQADGKLRASDNWQKGIPIDAYMKSGWRHWFSVWKKHRANEDNIKDLCAVLFNVQGMLHEKLKEGRNEEAMSIPEEKVLLKRRSAAHRKGA